MEHQMQPVPPTVSRPKKRVQMAVDACHVPHIKATLAGIDCEDVSLAPIISGWGIGGYWSSENRFDAIGSKIMVRFTADAAQIEPLLATGFGILALEIIPISATHVIN
jgi:hypothetical protein